MPRLVAAGADLDLVEIIDAVRDEKGQRSFNLAADIDRLEKLIAKFGDVDLVTIDPISAYLGKGMEFTAVAAIVVGGVSLFGGRGTILPGVLLGAFAFTMIANGLNQMSADPYAYKLVTGGLIFIAMYVDALRTRRQIGRRRGTAGGEAGKRDPKRELAEGAQHAAHGGIAGSILERVAHIGGGGSALAEEDVAAHLHHRCSLGMSWREAIANGERAIERRRGVGIRSGIAVERADQFERPAHADLIPRRPRFAKAHRLVEPSPRIGKTFELNQDAGDLIERVGDE